MFSPPVPIPTPPTLALLLPILVFCLLPSTNGDRGFRLNTRTGHHQVRQAAHLQGRQGHHHQGHQAGQQVHGRHAPHTHSQIQSHFNSLRRLTPLLPFPPLPRHHHKQLQRVQPGSKAHRQQQQQQQHGRQNNGKKRELDKGGVATLSRTKV